NAPRTRRVRGAHSASHDYNAVAGRLVPKGALTPARLPTAACQKNEPFARPTNHVQGQLPMDASIGGQPVIPAQAGIQTRAVGHVTTTLDTRLRGCDAVPRTGPAKAYPVSPAPDRPV